MEGTKKCPYCAEEIKAIALICRHCRSRLDGGPDLVPVSRSVEALRSWLKSPNEPIRPRRRLSILFWVLAILCWGLVLSPIFLAPKIDEAVPFCILMAVFFGWIPLIVLGFDLTRIYPETCRDPARALRGFAQAVKRRNWKLAREFVAPPDFASSLPRATPEQHKVTAPSASFAFSQPDGFLRYWKWLCTSHDGRNRYVRCAVENVRSNRPGLASGEFEMKFTSYSQLGFFFFGLIGYYVSMKRGTFRFRKLLLQKGERWYLPAGDADDRLDRSLEDALTRPAEIDPV